MSENTSEVKPVVLEYQDIIEFLELKTKNKTCLICGVNNFSLLHKFDGEAYANASLSIPAINYDGNQFISPPSLPLIALVCNECGSVRFHAKRIIENWVEKKNNESL